MFRVAIQKTWQNMPEVSMKSTKATITPTEGNGFRRPPKLKGPKVSRASMALGLRSVNKKAKHAQQDHQFINRKKLVIAPTDARTDPWAMVVHAKDAKSAH